MIRQLIIIIIVKNQCQVEKCEIKTGVENSNHMERLKSFLPSVINKIIYRLQC